eukprot:2976454-Rhodomonas_salina.2
MATVLQYENIDSNASTYQTKAAPRHHYPKKFYWHARTREGHFVPIDTILCELVLLPPGQNNIITHFSEPTPRKLQNTFKNNC